MVGTFHRQLFIVYACELKIKPACTETIGQAHKVKTLSSGKRKRINGRIP